MAYRSSSIAKSSVNVTSLAVTAPAGAAVNDVIVGYGEWDSNGSYTIGLPSGFTAIAASAQASTFDGENAACGYKVETGTPPANYTFTSSTSNDCTAAVAAYSGINTSAPLHNSNGTSVSTGGTDPRSMAITGFTTTATCDLVYIGIPDWNGSGGARTFTAPSGFTTRQSDYSTNLAASFIADKVAVAAGATGTVTGVAGGPGTCGYIAYLLALENGAAGPVVSGGTANPVHLSTGNTITGINFGASQGTGTLVIGGVTQTVTAWADTSITYTANRGTNLDDVAVNAVVTDNNSVASNSYALTGFDPPSGYSYVTLVSVNATAAHRITALGDLAIGNQLEWDNSLVTIYDDGTFVADPTVTSFNVRVGVTTDGWGALAVQNINLSATTGPGRSRLALKMGIGL